MSDYRGLFTIDAAARYQNLPHEVIVTQLGPGLWTASAGTYRTVFVEGYSSIIAINTFGTPGMAASYRHAIEQTVPGKPIGTIIQSIDHLDHTGYGQVLAPSADVVAHELAAGVIAGRNADGQLPATHIIHGTDEELIIDGVAVRLQYPAPTMGTGNLGIQFLDHQVLFVIGPQAGARYGLFPDVHFRHFVPGIRQLITDDIDTVVTGRRAILNSYQALVALDYLIDFQTACQEALVAGTLQIWLLEPVGEFLYQRLADKWAHLDGFDIDNLGLSGLRCINHYYMGGWGLEDTNHPELIRSELPTPGNSDAIISPLDTDVFFQRWSQ